MALSKKMSIAPFWPRILLRVSAIPEQNSDATPRYAVPNASIEFALTVPNPTILFKAGQLPPPFDEM
jgi:hypothetical protein